MTVECLQDDQKVKDNNTRRGSTLDQKCSVFHIIRHKYDISRITEYKLAIKI